MTELKILLVDDSEDEHEFYVETLNAIQDYTFQIESALDANEALEMARNNQYDCVLLDYNMPGHNGLWLVRELRNYNIQYPLIMMTGGGSERVAVEALKSGTQDYIAKQDINPESLKEILTSSIEEKKSELELLQRGHFDQLTGLANRYSFFRKLELTFYRAERYNRVFAVMFIDMNKFKSTNDTFGHQTGDELLKMIAGKLKESTRDFDIVARLGGDEFVIILDELTNDGVHDVTIFAERLIENINNHPFIINGQEINTGVSIGVAIYPTSTSDLSLILDLADKAMYVAKQKQEQYFSIAGKEE